MGYKALGAAYATVGNAKAAADWAKSIGKNATGPAKKPDAKPAKKPDAKPAKKPDTPAKKKAEPLIENGFLPPLKTLNVLASAFAPKDQKKKVATGGKRRMQAVEPTKPADGKATMTISTTGVDLNTSQTTFASPSDAEFSGDGASEMSGNLLKFASALVASLLVLLN